MSGRSATFSHLIAWLKMTAAALIAGSVFFVVPSTSHARAQNADEPTTDTCRAGPAISDLLGDKVFGHRQRAPSRIYAVRIRTDGTTPAPATPMAVDLATPAPTPVPLPICIPTPTATPSPTGETEPDTGSVSVAPTATPDVEVAQPANVARLARFIETETGRRFDAAGASTPAITFVQPSQLGPPLSTDALIATDLWNLVQVAGLVDVDADHQAAATAWGETARGVCCPAVVVDGHDRASNEIIIVHELTHALDYSLFANPSTTEVIAPERAIVEGNAHRIAYLYADALVDAGIGVPAPPGIFPPGADPRMPAALRQILEYPYDEGKQFAEAIAARGGETAILEAFARPPIGAEVLDPDLWFEQRDWLNVASPTHLVLDPAADQGQLGAFITKLLIGRTTDIDTADRLARTWQGDAYVLTQTEHRRCIGIRFAFADVGAATEVAAALEVIEHAGVTVQVEQVEFRRCVYPETAR